MVTMSPTAYPDPPTFTAMVETPPDEYVVLTVNDEADDVPSSATLVPAEEKSINPAPERYIPVVESLTQEYVGLPIAPI